MNAVVSLWMVDADAVPDADLLRYRSWLSPGETARYQRFVRAQRQRQFVVGRVLLRAALAQLLGVTPQDVVLEEQVGKAPRLVTPLPATVPGFSIAHSGRWVACAVSRQTALGLDIEMRDPGRDLSALASQAFDAVEMAQWERMRHLSEEQRIDSFYRMWSEKEARFKLGVNDGGHCVAVPHVELSMVVCSEQPLARPPKIEMVALP